MRDPRGELFLVIEAEAGDEPELGIDRRREHRAEPAHEQRLAIRVAVREIQSDQLAARIAFGLQDVRVDRELFEIELLGELGLDLAPRH